MTRVPLPRCSRCSRPSRPRRTGSAPIPPRTCAPALELPATTVSTEHLIRDASGQVAQWWVALRDAGDPITQAWVCPHPDLPDAVSDELARTGWVLLLDWIRAHPVEGGNGELRVHSGCPAGSAVNPRHLAEAGFTHQRTFWEMTGPVTEESRIAPEVPGLVIEATQDVAAIHGVLNEAFVGHYGFTPMSLENWRVLEESMAGYDPNLRYLATIDGEPAAAMLLSRRVETEGAMYVGELGTLEKFRRRGIVGSRRAKGWAS